MKLLKTFPVTERLSKINRPIVLEENSRTRRLFVPQLGKDSEGKWNVRGTLVVERKGKTGWQALEATHLASLPAGDLLKLELRTEHLKRLFSGLQVLMQVAAEYGIVPGSQELFVGHKDEFTSAAAHEYRAVIQELVNGNHGADFWETLRSIQPDIATHLAEAEIQRRRKAALGVFQNELLLNKWSERQWEIFFVENRWIFGYGLRYQFLSLVQNQPNYGGADFTQKGGQKGDFLMQTEGEERFTVLVEIKRPDSAIFDSGPDSRSYRNGVPGFSTEFSNAISQVQVNSNCWEVEGSRREKDRERLSRAGVYTISPRSILIYGHTSQLQEDERRRSFELFRVSLKRPDIITFDELFDRARFIVSETDK